MGEGPPLGGVGFSDPIMESLVRIPVKQKNGKNNRVERIIINESYELEEIFLIVESVTKGKSLATYIPFLFATERTGKTERTTENAIGYAPLQNTLLRDGKILIKVKNRKDKENLKKKKLSWGKTELQVKVKEHKTLNSCKGIVRCDAFKFMTENELKEGLINDHVSDVYIFKRKNFNGELVNTRTAIITFDKTKPPKDIHIGYF